MLRIILAIVLLSYSLATSAQTPDYESIVLDRKEDYTAAADQAAGTAAQYLLTTAPDKNSMPRLQAAKYLLRWMTGTPSYNFSLGEEASKISKSNEDLMLVYMAAMTKFCLDNPADSKDTDKVRIKTIERVLDYCKEQNIPVKGELKKLKEKREKGEL